MSLSLNKLKDALNLTLLTPDADLTREAASGYACDLLSWVLAHGAAGMAWITVQTHMNTVAVATLLDMSCVILPDNIQPEPDTLVKAKEEGVAILVSSENAYAISGRMYALGIPPAVKA